VNKCARISAAISFYFSKLTTPNELDLSLLSIIYYCMLKTDKKGSK